MVTVSGLRIYPIKSCRGISLDVAEVDKRGLRLDRRWMVVDSRGRFITQRTAPRLALVDVQLGGDSLRIGAPGMEELECPMVPERFAASAVTIWNDRETGLDAGDEAAVWFSAFLGLPCRLVSMPEGARRTAHGGGARSLVGFADAYPFLLISEESLADLNDRLDSPLPMDRFRPNIVVTGCEPYGEDGWREIEIGGIRFHIVKPCSRCVTTTVDQATAAQGEEPLRTLARYRRVGGKVMFGQNLIHTGTGVLHVGDGVKVLARRTDSLAASGNR